MKLGGQLLVGLPRKDFQPEERLVDRVPLVVRAVGSNRGARAHSSLAAWGAWEPHFPLSTKGAIENLDNLSYFLILPWPCRTWISIMSFLQVILHPGLEEEAPYEDFEIK